MDFLSIGALVVLVAYSMFSNRKHIKNMETRMDTFLQLNDLSGEELEVFEKQLEMQAKHMELEMENSILLERVESKLDEVLGKLRGDGEAVKPEELKLIGDSLFVKTLDHEIKVEEVNEPELLESK